MPRSDFVDWILLPFILPMLLGLLILGVAIWHG
jgi:hypothetical protein